MARPALNAYRVGDWKKAERALQAFTNIGPAAALIVRQEAEELKARVVHGLWSGQFDRQYRWQALSDITIKLRAPGTKDNPKLIEHGDYVDAIRVVTLGVAIRGSGRVWGVGVPGSARNRNGELIAAIGAAHEFGGGSSSGEARLPARPFWRSEYAASRARLYTKMLAYLKLASRVRGANLGNIRSVRGQIVRHFRP
jgi:hypothetical protein